MKIATWNVNSLKIRLPQVLLWLKDNPVEILCLQETKLTNDKFPVTELETAGYQAVFTGQKTYNGVAILAKQTASDIIRNNPLFPDEQQRIIAATFGKIRIVCIYVPNGQIINSDKFQYKIAWLKALQNWLETEKKQYPYLALLGDYNIAPEDRDVYDPVAWKGNILVSEPERMAFLALLDTGFVDAFRLFDQPEKSWSWWDYRQLAFQRNCGLRLDHILLSKELASFCTGCTIDRLPRKWNRPSDHTPVIAELRL